MTLRKWTMLTFTDERGRPSSTRQIGFITLLFMMWLVLFDYPQPAIETVALLVTALLVGSQLPKIGRGKDRFNESG